MNLPNGEAVGYEWESDGLLKQVGYTSGMSRRYVYDEADRVTNIKNVINGNESQEFSYGYDRNANRISEAKKQGGRLAKSYDYQYDALNRLTQSRETQTATETQPEPNQSVTVNEVTNIVGYEYDEVGNRTKEKTQTESIEIVRTANGQGTVSETRGSPTLTLVQTATASFDDLNRLISLTESDGTQNSLSYDANGNLLQTKRNNVVTQIYEYDPRNQLRKVLGADNTEIARFDYDESRRRVEKTVYGLTPERYVYAGDKIVAEYRGNSGYETNQAKYQIGADEVVRAEFANGNEGARYYFTDALGSTTALAGQISGTYQATNHYDYNDWGKVSTSQQSNNSIGYTGQRLDVETGLMALGNGERYYSPTLARFIQQDSFAGRLDVPASLNRFSYVHNNPYKYTDPTGHIIETVCDVASLTIGVYSFYSNIKEGNYWSAGLDAVGIIADAAAVLIPGIPGGVGAGIRASRTTAQVVKAVQTADRAINAAQSGCRRMRISARGTTRRRSMWCCRGCRRRAERTARRDCGIWRT